MTDAYNTAEFNVGHSIFPGYNDRFGLVICGYEWGYSSRHQELEKNEKRWAELQAHLARPHTFYSKGWDSPYDKRIFKWFENFGHRLGDEGGFSAFDKTILQTNWCDDQGTYVSDYEKFLSDANVANFLGLMKEYQPALLMFMGTRQIEYLQDARVKTPFEGIFGKEVEGLQFKKNETFPGRQFRIGFQKFERVSIVSLPHPSGSHGLSDEYISLFAGEIGELISQFKVDRETIRTGALVH